MSFVSLPWDEQPGQPSNINHVMENDEALALKINGNIDADNLTPAEAAKLGLSVSGTARRGKTTIATMEARSSAAFGLLTTPDRVSGLVLPADGLIAVAFQALWQEAVTGQAFAAIFVNANQLKVQSAGIPGPSAQSIGIGGTAARDAALSTMPGGLQSIPSTGGSAAADVTTGQAVGIYPVAGNAALGGPCYIFAAAGTYDVSVQFRSLDASAVTVKGRKLWAWTIGF